MRSKLHFAWIKKHIEDTMYKTQEVRWFFPKPLAVDESILTSSGLSFRECEPRVDFYLAHVDANLGIKIRESKVEVKEQRGRQQRFMFDKSVTGYRQDWVKWSFTLKESDDVINTIYRGHSHWLRVEKAIISLKIYRQNGTTNVSSALEETPPGCQVDYTRVTIRNRHWFTLGLECFGDAPMLADRDWLHGIFGGMRLSAQSSMSYPEFLSRFY